MWLLSKGLEIASVIIFKDFSWHLACQAFQSICDAFVSPHTYHKLYLHFCILTLQRLYCSVLPRAPGKQRISNLSRHYAAMTFSVYPCILKTIFSHQGYDHGVHFYCKRFIYWQVLYSCKLLKPPTLQIIMYL